MLNTDGYHWHCIVEYSDFTSVSRIAVFTVVGRSVEVDIKMESVGRLEWPDYLVLAVFLAISLGIGVYHSLTGGRQRTTEEFIMANRRLGILPTTLSLFVSYSSAIGMLGLTAEMYMYGIQFMLWLPIGSVVSTVLVERLVVPWIFPLRLVSVNDVSSAVL